MRPAPNPSRAIALKLFSVTAFVAMASLIKATSDAVPPGQAVFFRSFFAMVVIIGWLVARGSLTTGLKVADPMSHVWRGLVGTTAMGLMFAGLGLLPLPEVTAIGYAAPLLVVILAAMFLGEQVRFFRLSAVAIGLLGVLIVLSPRLTSLDGGASDGELLGAVVVLAGAAGAALAQVFVRKMVETEETSAIVFWFSITSTVMSLLTIPYGWQVPSPQVAGMLILAGLLGGLGQIGLTSAYRYADAGVVAPFDYFSMLLALVVGYFVFGEVPTPTVLFGASLVISAGILIIWRERQLGLERARQRESAQQKGL
jgi:drug/metabolite transporter (DMT)-like permease